MKVLHFIAYILIIIGGLNWGLIGFFHFNLVNKVLGSVSWLETLVYVLVGLAALVEIFTHKGSCKHCETKPAAAGPVV